MEWFQQTMENLKGVVSPWVYGPLAFLLWVLVLNVVKHLLISRIKSVIKKTPLGFGEALLDGSRFPLGIAILGSGIYILGLLLPLEQKYQAAAIVAFQASVVLGGILFIDHAVRKFGILFSERAEFAFFSKGILQGLVRGTIIGLGLLVFLDMIGISITPILASLGIGSLAVALALQDTLANFFAGIYITIDKPVREGDFVKLESGAEGYVAEVGWRSTKIQILPDKVIIVPNQKLISSIITNYYLPTREVAVTIPVGVSYDSDLRKVEEITLDVARQVLKTVQGAVPTFEPVVRFQAFESSSINFNVILRAKEFSDQHLLRHEFIKVLHERYRKESIVIPYPIQTLDIPKETLATLTNR